MAKVLRRRSAGTAATIAVAVFVLIAVVISSAVPGVAGAGRPGRLRAAPTTTMTTAAAAAMKPDQTATSTESSAGPSGCSNSPSNGGARCPHRQTISSTNPSNQTTN
jgi:hypothetical protein